MTDQHSESHGTLTGDLAAGGLPTAGRNNPLVTDAYGVKLEAFEGPLDLLLFLIRKNEVDIYDIPVATITAQYLAVLNQVRLLDLEGASDFVLMAATLMKIKSQMLLPREVMPDAEDGEADPRQELVRRLLEYQQFKEVAEWLGVQGLEQRDVFARGRGAEEGEDGEMVLHQVSLFDLLAVYKHVLDNVPRAIVHRIVEEKITIEECIDLVLGELERRSRLRFYDLVSGQSRETMVATFISILELLKSQRIKVQQSWPFEEIWIERRTQESGELGIRTALTDAAGGGRGSEPEPVDQRPPEPEEGTATDPGNGHGTAPGSWPADEGDGPVTDGDEDGEVT
ncbi:MAG: segregation/condensation protein A [Gemmatimonadota bacterium]